MTYNPEIHHRRSIRLKDYDYSQEGAYFVTICTYKRIEMFGEIINGVMHLNECGKIAQDIWDTLPGRFPGIELDHFIVMPNHVHGIIVRTELVRANFPSSVEATALAAMNALQRYRTTSNRSQSLKEIVRTFKGAVTYYMHTKGTLEFGWQHNYYEHIIRNTKELTLIRDYIINNPQKWQEDKLHPSKPPL